jgi:putative protease
MQIINPTQPKKVELLLPVGSKEMAMAAIHNGADAIFIGVPGFNARGRSHDFEITSLKEIIELCHLYKVKVNLAFNVVIFQDEIEAVVKLLAELLPLKPDAFIVQDLGLVQLIRQMAPNQRIHASTQMTITNHEAIELLEDLDIKRFVLGRENSLDDIKKIRANTPKELETFVHGALCVSYSGQCFTSEGLGGRSANRGQCAQSCRLSYELQVDGEKKDLGNKKYLVSPQDLCGIDDVESLVASGVDCFKIEGRLKTPEYVATAARAYRNALNKALGVVESRLTLNTSNTLSKKDMAISYSRGFFSGWLHGVNHQKLVNAEFSSHRGYEIGKVVDVFKNRMIILVQDEEVYHNLQPGDGLLWTKGTQEQGGFIYAIDRLPPSRVRIELARDMVLLRDLEGARVYQNHDKELKKAVAQSMEDKNKKKRLEVRASLTFIEGQPLHAVLTDGEYRIEGNTATSAVLALNKAVTDENLKEEFSSLTGSIFRLQDLKVSRTSSDALFLPHREIKTLRQSLVTALTEKRQVLVSAPVPFSEQSTFEWVQSKATAPKLEPIGSSWRPRLNVLLRDKGQVEDLVEAFRAERLDTQALDTLTLDFEFGRDYQQSVELLRSLGVKVGLATTRILKPNEYRNLKILTALKPDSILVRNLGALRYLTQKNSGAIELRGDFSLNVSNHLTADYLLNKGLASLCVSYDLNQQQVSKLLQKTPASKIEVTVYQYMPSFHMEHCVFAAFLSEGSSYRDCGKPCEKHEVRLKDQFQNWHQIKPDQECRNTMYNAKAQSAARFLHDWSNEGLGFVRYEALKERGNELVLKLAAHIELLKAHIDFTELMTRVGAIESYGISEGQLGRDREYQSRKKSE